MTDTEEAVIAVVGAAGFIGRSLVEHWRVDAGPALAYTRANPCVRDGTLDEGVATAQAVFWLATQVNPLLAEQHPERALEDQNVFSDFLRRVEDLPRPPRVVLLSSGGTVYGSQEAPFIEAATPAPSTAYGRAKREMEQILQNAALPNSAVVRVSNAYGPGQPVASGQGVIAHWLRAARRGEPLVIYGNPMTRRDYVYIGDIVRALGLIATAEVPPVVNIGSGCPTSLRALADLILDVVEDPGLKLVVAHARTFDLVDSWLDVSLAARELGWVPQMSLHDGLSRAWDAVRALGDPAP